MGGHIAAHLARAGVEVSVLARGAHLSAIRSSGLRMIAQNGEAFTVRLDASDNTADLGPQDLVISTLKAHTLSDAAVLFKPLLHASTPIIFAVNGIPWWYFHGIRDDAASRLPRLDPKGLLWQEVGPERVLGCVIRSPNQIVSPGVIRVNSPTSRFAIGEPTGTMSSRLSEIVALLNKGLPGAVATNDIRGEIWSKLMLNLPSSLLSTLTVSTQTELFADPGSRELYRQLAEEGRMVAASYGIDVTFDLDAQVAAAGNHRHPPSMLQDLIAGRSLELDAQVRAVQDLARQSNVQTPILDVTLSLLAQRARSEYAASLL